MPKTRKVDLLRNTILEALPPREIRFLLSNFRLISLAAREVLYRPDDHIRYVYFPQDSVVSLLSLMHDGRTAAISVVGSEGLVGLPPAILGSKTASFLAVAQVPGDCLRIEANALQSEFRRCDVLHDCILAYTRYLLAQISQTAACNGLHLLEQRLARWLLMIQDRAGRDTIPITHEFLSSMLGISRSEVTHAAGHFRASRLIRYGRGRVSILDRKRLESVACECYKAIG